MGQRDAAGAVGRAPPSRGFAAYTKAEVAAMPHDEWMAAWRDAVSGIKADEVTYTESAEQLRALIKTGLLRFTDLRDNPRRFFAAHRALAEHSPRIGPGFFIRFTVQYNLFAGTVLGLAGAGQVDVLDAWQEEGALGCFALTETLAGVNSGLVVETTAEWRPETGTFVLNSPDGGSAKRWISQGLVADKALVLASLSVGGQPKGPHAFVADFRNKAGEVLPGISLSDMGPKTVGNDLDNASIAFEGVELPRSALLNRFAAIADTGEYVRPVEGIRAFDMIGQRLFTGRVAVAQAAMEFRRALFKMTRAYSDTKQCWSPKGRPVLSDIPQLKALYAEEAERAAAMDGYLARIEEQLCACLEADAMPDARLTEAIAVAKVRAVEEAIELSHRLRQEVGSHALMATSGFAQTDFLQCCKFAEGDSRILMLKMARDRLRAFEKGVEVPGSSEAEEGLCRAIAAEAAAHVKAGGDKATAFDAAHVKVYQLAEAVMGRVQEAVMRD